MIDKNHPDPKSQLDLISNDNTIVPFKPKLVEAITPEVTVGEPDPEVIKMLEFYLLKARAGEIRFLALAVVDHEGVAQSTWAPLERGPQHTTQAAGAVAYLSARFSQAMLDGEDDADQWTTD